MGKGSVFYPYCELIATEAGRGGAFSHRERKGAAELAQKFVASNMTTGIVDYFELIEIHKTQGVLAVVSEYGGE